MLPKERFVGALNLEEIDRVPALYQQLSAGGHLLDHTGLTIREGFHDPEKFAKICMAQLDLFPFDNLMAFWGDILIEAQAFGTRVEFDDERYYPKAVDYGVKNAEDVDSLEVVDPMDDPIWSVPLEAAALMRSQVGEEVMVMGGLNSPFVVASEVWGYERFLISLIKQPDTAESLLEKISESQKLYAEHLADHSGVECCTIEDASAGKDQNSPDLCRRFDLNYCGKVVETLKRNGIKVIIQNSTVSPYLEDQLEILSPDALHFDLNQVQPEKLISQSKNTCLIPGLDHNRLIYNGNENEIRESVRGAIETFQGRKGLMIAPAGEMPFDTPKGNVRAFLSAVSEYGGY